MRWNLSDFYAIDRLNLPPDTIEIFTDGSKLTEQGSVGTSIYISQLNKNISHKLPSKISIFSAWAILEAVNLIEDFGWEKVTIFFDPLSVIRPSPAESGRIPPKPVTSYSELFINFISSNLKKFMLLYARFPLIRVFRVTNSAKKACKEGYVPLFRISFSDFFTEAKLKLYNYNRMYLELWTLKKNTLYFFKDLPRSHGIININLIVKKIVLINRIQSKHYNLNYELH